MSTRNQEMTIQEQEKVHKDTFITEIQIKNLNVDDYNGFLKMLLCLP